MTGQEVKDVIFRFKSMIAAGTAAVAVITGILVFSDSLSKVYQSDPAPLAGKASVQKLAQNFEKQGDQIQKLADTIERVDHRLDSNDLTSLIAQRGDIKLRLRSAPGDTLLRSILASIETRIVELGGRIESDSDAPGSPP